MAEITPVYDLVCLGSGTIGTEEWIDIASFGPDTNSPIPNGKQLWLGYATFIAGDKPLVFSLRPNLPGKSLGTVAETQLRSFTSVPKEDSKDIDLNFFGSITTLAPVSVPSTGIEKLWLRVQAGAAAVTDFDFIMYYALY